MTDLVSLIEKNRFVGREFLLWLWFESELHETELRPSKVDPCSLWLEAQLTLVNDGEESRLKSPMPAASHEAKEALRRGKLPREARFRLIHNDHEFAWVMKADELAIGGLKVPGELNAEDKYEALYERMMLVEELETELDALFADFMALRLSDAWERVVVVAMKTWANGKTVDEAAYAKALKAALPKPKSRKPEATPA